MNAAPKPKSAAEHQARTADKHPKVELVPDDQLELDNDQAAEPHPQPGEDGICRATRYQQGHQLVCELPVHHAGNHADGQRGWRRSSGDPAEIAEALADDPEDEPTA